MCKIQPIIDYIIDTYEFEITPCSIPRSNFQYFKRSFYIFIYNKISPKLFYFLRDKISSIKYLNKRPDGSIWLSKRDEYNKLVYEVEIKPYHTEATIYITDTSGIFKPVLDDVNYKVKIYKQNEGEVITFPFNYKSGILGIDSHFKRISDLKMCLRNKKINDIL
jgi:hypothetical protein